MGIASRMLRLCKADLHGVLDQMEDRELLLKQYLREMEEALSVNRTQLDGCCAQKTKVEHEWSLLGDKIKAMEEDIALAVAKQKDDIARMLIKRIYPLRQTAADLEGRMVRLEADVADRQEAYARQMAVYERIRQRAAVADGGRAGLDDLPPDGRRRNHRRSEPSEEEIELELLMHKEALQAGRSS